MNRKARPSRNLIKPYQDRELSMLSFNERVLQEAEDGSNPLMERLRFLGIFSSNMDEFFKVRVASLHRRMEIGETDKRTILELVTRKAQALDRRFQAAYGAITAELAAENVRIVDETAVEGFNAETRDWLSRHFRRDILPSLVPLIIDEAQAFPQLEDNVPYLAIRMHGTEPRYAILEIPQGIPRFVELPNGAIMYVDDVIRYALDDVFYIFEYDRIEAYEFKIVRDAELDVDNDFSQDYVERMEEELQHRKGGRPVRLVYDAAIPPVMLRLLMTALRLSDQDPLVGGGRYHNMKDLMAFPGNRPDLSWPRAEVAPHPALDQDPHRPALEVIAHQDALLTYPYQSFDHIVRLMREAAIDPKVSSIKMTIYRVARNSQIVNALVNAAKNGKHVVVNVELQARFDEQHNIDIASRLDAAGATVIYGVPPMKVHSKLLLIERGNMKFAALATGNFNEVTGKLYVDSALLTADPRLTDEVDEVFAMLENATRMRLFPRPKLRHLIVSPLNSRRRFSKLIEEQTALGRHGYILIKANHLTDRKMAKKLREAADAGVRIDLIVRTTYVMAPHKNIRAISIVDRYLEHQRAYVFGAGKHRRVYLGSSDLMERNLDWRLEAAFPILDHGIQEEIVNLLQIQLQDDTKARVLDAKQSNAYVNDRKGRARAQDVTANYFRDRAAALTPEQIAEAARTGTV